MKISEQQYRIITLIFMLLPAAGLALFNIYLIRDIEAIRKAQTNRVSLAESPVFIAAIEELRRGIREAKDIRTALKQKPMTIRRAVPLSWYGSQIKVFDRLLGDGFLGLTTANGEILNAYDNTCATKDQSIPMGTIIWLYVLETERVAWCRKVDHAPAWATVEVDVNFRVATDLDIVYRGGGTAIVFY